MAATVTCSNITILDQCSANLNPTRNAFSSPVAFVLHCIPFDASTYLSMSATPFAQGEGFFTDYPKSVNYFISTSGFVWELVPPTDTAWGITEFNGASWATLTQYTNIVSPNEPFLHIGFEGDELNTAQQDVLINLICCLALQYGIPLTTNNIPNVLFPAQLDTRLNCPSALPANLLEITQLCLTAGGISPLAGNLTQIASDVNALTVWRETVVDPTLATLTACCNTLTTRVSALETSVQAIETQLTQVNSLVGVLQTTVDSFEAQINENTKKLVEHQACVDLICKPQEVPCVSYQLHPQDSLVVTPGVERRLTLPQKIFDTNPPTMNGSVLQNLCLNNCTFNISATVRLAISEYCQNRIVRLYYNTCTGQILLSEFVVPADGAYTVNLSGSTQVVTPPACNTNYLSVWTDDVTTPTKTVEFASIEACCDQLTCPEEPFTIPAPIKTFPNTVI